MIGLIAATSCGFFAGWICRELQRPMGPIRGGYGYHHLGRNLPPPDLLPMPPAPPWEEGPTQRGNGHGGTGTPKPPIKPLPSGGTPNPLREAPLNSDTHHLDKPEFPPPRVIREDFLP